MSEVDWDQSYPPSLWTAPEPPEESPARQPTGGRAGASGKAQGAKAPQALEESATPDDEESKPKRGRRKAGEDDS
jgi:hypothetical protein